MTAQPSITEDFPRLWELSKHKIKIRNWRNRHHNDQLTKVDRTQERSISILQNRYGYSEEKAKSELSKHYSKALLG